MYQRSSWRILAIILGIIPRAIPIGIPISKDKFQEQFLQKNPWKISEGIPAEITWEISAWLSRNIWRNAKEYQGEFITGKKISGWLPLRKIYKFLEELQQVFLKKFLEDSLHLWKKNTEKHDNTDLKMPMLSQLHFSFLVQKVYHCIIILN